VEQWKHKHNTLQIIYVEEYHLKSAFCDCIVSEDDHKYLVTFFVKELLSSTKNVVCFCLFVSFCLSVSRITQKVVDEFWQNFFWRAGMCD